MEDDVVELLYKTVYDGKGAKEAKQDMKDTKDNAKDAGEAGKKMASAFTAVKWAVLGQAIGKVAGKIAEVSKVSANYIETLNVLQVAFDGNTESIRKFSSQLSDTLNLDDSTIISAAAHFKVLSKSMGIATETGEKLSRLLTQMTLDLSSLYNIDFSKAQTALQYAMEGRGTSLKQRTGVSVLETSVQTTMDVLGIDAYVEDMSDAEKAIARVITMEYQLMSSQGDLARTIEAPANQMRVMKEQVTMLARNIGNVLLPVVAKILPYFNAILIVLNAIISALARLVGYREDMFDTFEEANTIDYFDGVGAAIDGVGESADRTAKKLQGLRGFDKLNVIKTPTDTGKASGGGAGGLGGINPNLLKAFNAMADQYKMKLEGVRTKATEIAEKILTWLGFAKKVNKETGKIEWYFKKLTGGTLIGAFGVGGFIYLGISKILNLLKKIGLIKFSGIGDLVKLFKNGTVAKNIATFTSGFEKLAGVFGMSAGTFAIVAAAIVAIGAALVYAYKHNEDFRNSVNDMLKSIGELFSTLWGVIQPVLQSIYDLVVPIWNQIKDDVVFAVGVIYDTIVFVFKDIADVIGGVAKIVTDLINGDFNKAFEDFKEMIVKVWNNWNDYLGKIGQRFLDWIGETIKNIKDFIPKAIAKMGELIDWLKELPEKFFYWAGQAVGTMWKVITETNWLELGGKVLTGIVDGIKDIGKKLSDFGEKIRNKIKESTDGVDWGQLGLNILKGIFNGMSGWNLTSQASKWGSKFAQGIKDALGIASPSKLMLQLKVGDYTLEGITEGMDRELGLVDKEANKIATTLQDGIDKATSNIKLGADIIPNMEKESLSVDYGTDLVNQINRNAFIPTQNNQNKQGNQNGLQSATFVIQVGDEQIAKKVLKDLNGMAKSNGKPITIRG